MSEVEELAKEICEAVDRIQDPKRLRFGRVLDVLKERLPRGTFTREPRRWWVTIYPEAGITQSIHTSAELAEMEKQLASAIRGTRKDLQIVEVKEVL